MAQKKARWMESGESIVARGTMCFFELVIAKLLSHIWLDVREYIVRENYT
jgi:hypothetical protein